MATKKASTSNTASAVGEADMLHVNNNDDNMNNGGDGFDNLDESSFDILANMNMPDTPGPQAAEQPLLEHDTPPAGGDGTDLGHMQALTDILGIEDSPAPEDAPRPVRRSPRIAAAAAARAGDGVHVTLPGAKARRGGASPANGVTPYSCRRGRRASQGFRGFTPGSAFPDGGLDEANASFR